MHVDSGSEFMAEFEDGCQTVGLPLLVLPPRSPPPDGILERANRTARVECWSRYRGELTCPTMNEALRSYLDTTTVAGHTTRPAPAEFAGIVAVAA